MGESPSPGRPRFPEKLRKKHPKNPPHRNISCICVLQDPLGFPKVDLPDSVPRSLSFGKEKGMMTSAKKKIHLFFVLFGSG